jgi:UDP-N-acetylmuramyl tripeptide synthase
VTIESDRAVAIQTLVDRADAKDVVLVAGKGHETYQEIQGVRHAFSDVEQVQTALQRRAARLSQVSQGVQA